MDIKSVISRWISEARAGAELSGEALGAKIALELGAERGHSKANISHWENGRHQPSVEQVLAISKITGKPLPDVLLKAFSPAAQSDVISNAIDINDLVELVRLFGESTRDGREQILRFARGAEKTKDQTTRPSAVTNFK